MKIDRSGYKCGKDVQINELDGCIVCADVALRRNFLSMYVGKGYLLSEMPKTRK